MHTARDATASVINNEPWFEGNCAVKRNQKQKGQNTTENNKRQQLCYGERASVPRCTSVSWLHWYSSFTLVFLVNSTKSQFLNQRCRLKHCIWFGKKRLAESSSLHVFIDTEPVWCEQCNKNKRDQRLKRLFSSWTRFTPVLAFHVRIQQLWKSKMKYSSTPLIQVFT